MSVPTSPSDVNLLAFSAAGHAYNPGASTNASDYQTLVSVSGLNLNPSNIGSFDSSLKVADGFSNQSLVEGIIGQGTEGCIDVCNGVINVTISATYGGAIPAQGQRVGSIKGGCEHITIVGERVTSGTLTEWLIGSWCDQSQAVDKSIDLTGVIGGGRVIIGRGFFAYLFGNQFDHKLGACKLSFWWSLGFWWYIRGKSVLLWLLNQGWIPTKVKQLLDASYK